MAESQKFRKELPVPAFEKQEFNMVSILKGCIGKELSKITMPVTLCEPLSFLQRMIEYMEYSYLLKLASDQDDPVNRMKYVAAFAVSALACNWERLGKPFNPLLGETYEIERDTFRCLCEQVSHHPPISAFHSDSPGIFSFFGSIYPKLKFWGKSVEIQPKGIVTVKLTKWNESYSWQNVNCTIHNVIVGKLWIEQYGNLEITNHDTGHKAVINFKAAGSNHKDLHRVEGTIQDKEKNKLFYLYGRWTELLKCTDWNSYADFAQLNPQKLKNHERSKSPIESSPAHTPRKVLSKLNSLKMSSFRSLSIQDDSHELHNQDKSPETDSDGIPRSQSLFSLDIPNSVTLWEVEPRPPNSQSYFNFTKFAMTLNEIEPHMKPPHTLCPTDSRLRPDIRKLEEGDIEGAINEKNRLEEKQRDARRARKSKKGVDDWKPRWFKLETNPITKQEDFVYSGGFWERNYDQIDLF